MGVKVKSGRGEHGSLSAPGKDGYGRLVHTLRRTYGFTKDAMAAGMYSAMQPVMLDAKERAPKDTLALAASGYVEKPTQSTQQVLVESGFGGDAENYALKVHEQPELTTTGEPFFFRNAIDAASGNIRDTIAAFVRRFLKSGKVPAMAAKQVPESPLEDQTRRPSRFK